MKLAVFISVLTNLQCGEMAEWSIAPVLKTGVGVTSPGVRLPLSPPFFIVVEPTNSESEPHSTPSLRYFMKCLEFVSFCERDSGGTMRIISARKATEKERRQFEEGI